MKTTLEKSTNIEEVRENVRHRDYESIEVTKTLVVTSDAVVIDSTHISSEEVVSKIVELAKERMNNDWGSSGIYWKT